MEYNELEEYEVYEGDYDEIDENEEELVSTEESTEVKNGQVEFKSVNHSRRAEKYERNSDGEVSKYTNYALEYFGHRCALSGEKFYKFEEKISGRGTNLSAEHIIALAIGGHDIVPNIVPTVLQYNIQKNGYYILDWWQKQEDINGKKIYSPYRLLKLVNFMMKSIEGRGLSPRKYHELLMKPNEIDKYLEKIEKEDLEKTDNSKRKILSDTETATTIDEDNNKILTTVPSTKGNIAEQVEDEIKRKEYNETEMIDTFLIDAVRVIKREKEISQEEIETENGNKITIENKLNQMLEKTIGKIPFEISVRNKILEKLEEIGIENNKYTVANVIFKNTDILEKVRSNKEININDYIKEIIQRRIETIFINIPRESKLELISVLPDLLYDDNVLKEYEDNLKWYTEYKNINAEEINPILLTRTYFINIMKIKEWMEENKTTKPPSYTSINEEEKNLGSKLKTIRSYLIKPYNILETEEEKEKYKIEHPELEEVMQIIDEIDRNNLHPYLVNAREIKKWMEDNNTTKPPAASSKDQIEKKLGCSLNSIKQLLIKPYKELETEEEKEQYKIKHPELEEVMQIIDEIDRNNLHPYLVNARGIKKWMEKNNTTKPPSLKSKDYEERKLSIAFSNIKQLLIKPYKELQTEEEKEQYIKQHPELEEVMQIIDEIDRNNIRAKEESAYYKNVIEIVKWMEENDTTKPPLTTSKNEEEKRLGNALSTIRKKLIKPYKELQTQEEKEQYIKQHPELEEVMQIVEEIDRNNIRPKEESPYYQNLLEIVKWMEDNNTTKPPSGCSKNQTEKKLGKSFSNIKQQLIKPYKELETEEEKEQYKTEHPELEEVMQIIDEIDRNNLHPYLVNAREIKKWMEDNNTTKPPSSKSKDQIEKKLGISLNSIKQLLIKPYKELEKEEEKEQYKIKHPELEEVMRIVEEIDRNNPRNISKKVKEVIVGKKQQLYENVEVSNTFEQVIKEVEKEEQNYGR